MGLPWELPSPLDQELTQEATRENLSPESQASILLAVATALLKPNIESAPGFQSAVQGFLTSRSLDSDSIAAALKQILRFCALHHVEAEGSQTFQKFLPDTAGSQPLDANLLRILRDLPKLGVIVQRAERVRRQTSVLGKYAGVGAGSEDYAREKQEEIAREQMRLS